MEEERRTEPVRASAEDLSDGLDRAGERLGDDDP